MKKNAVAIGVSSLEFMNILLTYYPKGIKETFDFYLFIDDTKVSSDEVNEVINMHNIPSFKTAKHIIIKDLYDYYADKHSYEGKAKDFLYTHGCLFKVLMPMYLKEKFGVERTYVSDDDVFIFNDLSYMFTKYKGFGYKKENLFNLRNKDKYEVLAAFNEIFEVDFSLEKMNALSINAGNIIYGEDPKMEYYFKRYMNHPMVHHLFFDFEGYTSWTVEQRFHHWNFHRLMEEGGACENIHGHTYHYTLFFEYSKVGKVGFSANFKHIKILCCKFIDTYFDHAYITNPEDRKVNRLLAGHGFAFVVVMPQYSTSGTVTWLDRPEVWCYHG